MDTPALKKTPVIVWVGRVISGLIAVAISLGGCLSIARPSFVVEDMAKRGFPEGATVPIGVAALVSAVLYAIPQTAVLGAILLTGYFGGAVVTHVHAGENFIAAIVAGILVWLGLLLRDERLRPLLPLRKL